MNLAPMILTLAVGLANSQTDIPPRFEGAWTLTSHQTSSSVARLAGLPVETIVLRLHRDGTFQYTVTSDRRSRSTTGTFDAQDDDLLFNADRPFPGIGGRRLKARYSQNRIDILGASLEAERSVVARPDPDLRAPRAEVELPPVTAPIRRYLQSATGSWTLRSNGREDRSNRFRFTNDGRWDFQGGNASSSGRYTLEDGTLTLYYEVVDGERVERPMQRVFVTSREDEFVIDRYRYQRQGS